MNNLQKKTLFFLILSFLFCVNSVYSFECCYVGGSIGINTDGSTCSERGLPKVGDENGDLCKSIIEEARRTCQASEQIFRNTIGGNLIFQIGDVIYPQVADPSNEKPLCIALVEYNPNYSGDISVNPEVGEGDNEGSGSEKEGEEDPGHTLDPNPVNTGEETVCSSAASPFSFFVDEISCESVPGCLYNPYHAGYFSAHYSNAQLGLEKFENSCIPKKEIKSCFDYKNELNCNENPSNLADSCLWVESSQFSDEIFNHKSGICISDEISEEIGLDSPKFYNKKNAYDRMNLVSDPSFELQSSLWEDLNRENEDLAYHNNYYANLGSGETISQIIPVTSDKQSYSIFLYAKSDFPNAQIEIEYGSKTNTLPITSKFFKKYDFGQMIGNSPKTELKITAIGAQVQIDAVSVEAASSNTQNPNTVNEIFKPVHIIPLEASNCNLCHDKLNINLCTQKKADLLGDCSYMASDISKPYESEIASYLGKDDNTYQDENRKWESQALARSLLFCEMYVDKNTCTSPQNHVNSVFGPYHDLSEGRTLCQWNENYGCFKDSNENNLPDSITSDEEIGDYIYTTSNEEDNSDFELACDSLPPNAYVYYLATNSDKEQVLITDGYDGKVGRVEVFLETSDVLLQSCRAYNIQNTLDIKMNVDENSGSYLQESNQYTTPLGISLQSFAENFGDEEFSIEDGERTISFSITDQSGNTKHTKPVTLDLDLAPPKVSLFSPQDFNHTQTLGKNTRLVFDVVDSSGVEDDACTFTVETNPGVDPSSYTAQGLLVKNEETSTLTVSKFEMGVPVSETSVNANSYLLKVTCEDIFGQSFTYPLLFRADFNTDILVLKPLPFDSPNTGFGFLNTTTPFNAVSEDKELVSCSFEEFENLGQGSSLNVEIVRDGFSVPGQSVTFYSNVTGSIGFSQDGLQTGKIVCRDNSGNSFSENISYYYDTKNPILESFAVIDKLGNEKEKFVVSKPDEDGNIIYYMRKSPSDLQRNFRINMNLSVDPTGTWVKDFISVLYNHPQYPQLNAPASNASVVKYNITQNTLEISFGVDPVIYEGTISEKDNNLRTLSFLLGIMDMAGNREDFEANLVIDNSTPSLEFGGDIISMRGNKIYTSKRDPQITIDLFSPAYRDMSCEITYPGYSPLLLNSTRGNISFTLSQISSGVDIRLDKTHLLNVDCEDIYNLEYSKQVEIVYDNTPPQLDSIALDSGSEKILWNSDNAIFRDLSDSLRFTLQDTGEEEYTCHIVFKPENNSQYDCALQDQEFTFTSFGVQKTSPIILVKGDNTDSSSACIRKISPNFKDHLQNMYMQDKTVESRINITGYCEDLVGHKSENLSTILNINYHIGKFVDFDLNYGANSITPIIKASAPFSTVKIYRLDGANRKILPEISSINTYSRNGENFSYTSPKINLESFNEGEYPLVAEGYDSSGAIVNHIYEKLIVDKTAPQVSLKISGMRNSKVYSKTFSINVIANDTFAGVVQDVQKVELYVNGTLVYDGEIVPNQYDISVSESGFIFRSDFRKSYLFKAVAYDRFSNSADYEIEIEVDPVIDITLLDTSGESLAVENSFEYITRKDAPVIRFELTGENPLCVIIPANDTIWKDSRTDKEYELGVLGNNVYSFDLSAALPGFNLSNVAKAAILLECNNEGEFVPVSFEIRKLTSLPDYVLESENGFVVNEVPFIFNASIRSVGPYKPISCSYSIGNSDTTLISPAYLNGHDLSLDMSQYSDGNYELRIFCEDPFGVKGPDKKYEIKVGKNDALSISDLRLVGERTYEIKEDSVTYVGETSLDLVFNLNRKSATCTYTLNSDSVVGFFRSLIGAGRQKVITSNPYEFIAQDISLPSPASTLRLNCNDGEISERYNLQLADSDIVIEISNG